MSNLQKPAPNGLLRVVATGERKDGSATEASPELAGPYGSVLDHLQRAGLANSVTESMV